MTRSKLLCTLVLIFVLPSIVLTISAHPGRTDGNGGHTDHDTGEYHYHHGYPPHDHTDLDGDGDLDCPYNFVDKTSHDSGGSHTAHNATTAPNADTSVESKAELKQVTFLDILKAMAIWLLPAIGLGFAASYLLFYLFTFLFGDEKGCSITWFSFILISCAAYIWLLFTDLT